MKALGRLIVIALFLILGLLALPACGPSSDSGTDSDATSGEQSDDDDDNNDDDDDDNDNDDDNDDNDDDDNDDDDDDDDDDNDDNDDDNNDDTTGWTCTAVYELLYLACGRVVYADDDDAVPLATAIADCEAGLNGLGLNGATAACVIDNHTDCDAITECLYGSSIDDDTEPMDFVIERIDGGPPGDTGFDIRTDAAGELVVSAVSGRDFLLYRAGPAAAEWTPQLLATLATRPSLVRDGAGVLHVLFVDSRNGTLMLGEQVGEQWSYSVLDQTPAVYYEYAKLIVGNDGFLHAIFVTQDINNHRILHYATNRSGAWATQTVEDPVDDAVSFGRFAVDASGVAYILSYYQGSTMYSYTYYYSYLYWLTNGSGAWTSQTLAEAESYSGGSSGYTSGYSLGPILAEPDGTIDVLTVYSYYSWSGPYTDEDYHAMWLFQGDGKATGQVLIDNTEEPLAAFDLGWNALDRLYAIYQISGEIIIGTREGDDWTQEALSGIGCGSARSTLAADLSLHLACGQGDGLSHVWKAGDAWTAEPIDSRPRLRTDEEGTPLGVVWFAGYGGAAAYNGAWADPSFRLAQQTGDGWAVQTLPVVGGYGGQPVMARGVDGVLHLAYRYGADTAIQYATNAGGDWTVANISSETPAYHSNPSLTLVEGSTPHVFYVTADGALRHVAPTAKGWTDEEIFSGPAGNVTAAADPDGALHLCAWSNGALVYASNQMGEWNWGVVSEGGDYVDAPCAIDALRPELARIVYFGCDLYPTRCQLKTVARYNDEWIRGTIPVFADKVFDGTLSMQATADGRFHIAARSLGRQYYDYLLVPQLFYATNADGRWGAAVVDHPGELYSDLGEGQRMVLDEAGRPQFFYFGYDAVWHASLAE
jgi:hypothetical protein